MPSVLWRCWLGSRKGIWPVKNWVVWLSVWSKVQTCIWPSWCHCHSPSLASVKSRLVLPFWYRLTWVVPERGPLNGCVCVCSPLAIWLRWRRMTGTDFHSWEFSDMTSLLATRPVSEQWVDSSVSWLVVLASWPIHDLACCPKIQQYLKHVAELPCKMCVVKTHCAIPNWVQWTSRLSR